MVSIRSWIIPAIKVLVCVYIHLDVAEFRELDVLNSSTRCPGVLLNGDQSIQRLSLELGVEYTVQVNIVNFGA